MNSIERHLKALRFEEADRVPVAPSFLTRAIRLAGVTHHAYHTRPEVLANAQILHCEAYDFDGVYISSDNVIMYEALGGRIVFPDEDSYPFWTDPVIHSTADVHRLRVPDPAAAGRMPVVLEAARLAARQIGQRRFVLANIDSGPFQLAATLMGMENAMTWLIERPDEMKEILAFCSEVVIAYGAAMAKTGCHAIQFGESIVSLIRRAFYEEIVWPFDRRVIEALRKTGVKVFLHVCGDGTPIIDLLAATGADCLELDAPVDLAAAKRFGVPVKGNFPTPHFLNTPPDVFLDECRRLITGAKPGGGFILAGGCEVPAETTDDIVRAFRQAADQYGRYD